MQSRVSNMAWLVVALLWGVALLNYLDRLMITTMRDSLRQAIPMTDSQFGLLTSVFLWVYGGLSPLAGFFADRFSRSRLIVISLLVWSAVTWLTGHAQTFEQLLAARAIMGISEACYIPAALALIADYHRGPTRSLATGVHMTGISVGSALGGVGGWLAERSGWSHAFSLFGVIGIGYAVVLALVLRDPPAEAAAARAERSSHGADFRRALLQLARDRTFLLLVLFWGLLGATGWVIVSWMPTYFNERFQLGQGAAGFSATGYLFSAALGGLLFGGAWADRWSRRNRRARILVPMIGLLIAAPVVVVAARSDLLVVAIGGLMVYGFTRSFSDSNMMPILCMTVDARYRATGYGVLNMFSCLAGGLGTYGGGYLKDHHVGLSMIFQLAAVLVAVCGVVLLLVHPPRRPGDEEEPPPQELCGDAPPATSVASALCTATSPPESRPS